MKNPILLLAIFSFCLCQISCENIQNQNSTNDGNSLLNSEDKFVGKWVRVDDDDYRATYVNIRKEKNLYIIEPYSIENNGKRSDYSRIYSGKLKDGSIEVNSFEIFRIDLSEQTNKLYFGGSEYTKE